MKRTPLPSHDWPDGRDAGPPQTCETCQAEWREGYDDPPPYSCKREPLERSTGVRKRNPERLRRRRISGGVKHTYGPAFRAISKLPCCVCGTRDGAPADHWVPVGRGGTDVANCLPICADHQDRHDLGPDTWAETHGVDPEAACERAWRTFLRRRPKLARKLEAAA